jgi:hypothetical protein
MNNFTETTQQQIIPARDGWFLCEIDHDEEGNVSELLERHIVAWQVLTWGSGKFDVDGKTRANPVVVEESLPSRYFVKSPSGFYELPEDRYNMTKEQALEYARKYWKE